MLQRKGERLALRRAALVSVLALAWTGAAGAADQAGSNQQSRFDEPEKALKAPDEHTQAGASGTLEQLPIPVEQAEQLMGKPVMTEDGEELGQVHQIVRNKQDDTLGYVIQPADGSPEDRVVLPVTDVVVKQFGAVTHVSDVGELEQFNQDQYQSVWPVEREQAADLGTAGQGQQAAGGGTAGGQRQDASQQQAGATDTAAQDSESQQAGASDTAGQAGGSQQSGASDTAEQATAGDADSERQDSATQSTSPSS
jgi:sporulation protein YlmC with PRC-barrel domain